MRRALAALLLLVGCTSEEPPGDCAEVGIESIGVVGPDGFVEPGDALEIAVRPPVDGVEIWSDGGLTGEWVALEPGATTVPLRGPLRPGATYTVRVRTCGVVRDEARISTVPEPVAGEVVGRSHLLDLRDPGLRWNEPPVPPPASVLDALLGETQGFLLMPTASGDGALDLAVTLADRSSGRLRQDRCVEPQVFPEVPFADPRFALGAPQLQVGPTGSALALWDLSLAGTYDAEGRVLRALRFAALVDTRTLSGSGASACELLGSLVDANCVPCPDQEVEAKCLLFDVTQPEATSVEEIHLDLSPAPHGGCR